MGDIWYKSKWNGKSEEFQIKFCQLVCIQASLIRVTSPPGPTGAKETRRSWGERTFEPPGWEKRQVSKKGKEERNSRQGRMKRSKGRGEKRRQRSNSEASASPVMKKKRRFRQRRSDPRTFESFSNSLCGKISFAFDLMTLFKKMKRGSSDFWNYGNLIYMTLVSPLFIHQKFMKWELLLLEMLMHWIFNLLLKWNSADKSYFLLEINILLFLPLHSRTQIQWRSNDNMVNFLSAWR